MYSIKYILAKQCYSAPFSWYTVYVLFIWTQHLTDNANVNVMKEPVDEDLLSILNNCCLMFLADNLKQIKGMARWGCNSRLQRSSLDWRRQSVSYNFRFSKLDSINACKGNWHYSSSVLYGTSACLYIVKRHRPRCHEQYVREFGSPSEGLSRLSFS